MDVNVLMEWFKENSGLSRGVVSHYDGLSSVVPYNATDGDKHRFLSQGCHGEEYGSYL